MGSERRRRGKSPGRSADIITDTSGHLVGAQVHTADIQDRDGAPGVLASIRYLFPWLRHVFADGAYAGEKLETALAGFGQWTLEIVKRSDQATGFEGTATALGGRANPRLVWSQPAAGEGFRNDHCQQRSVALSGFGSAAGTPARAGAHNSLTCRQARTTFTIFGQPKIQALLRHLVTKSDVVVENFSPGVMARAGLAYENSEGTQPVHCYVLHLDGRPDGPAQPCARL